MMLCMNRPEGLVSSLKLLSPDVLRATRLARIVLKLTRCSEPLFHHLRGPAHAVLLRRHPGSALPAWTFFLALLLCVLISRPSSVVLGRPLPRRWMRRTIEACYYFCIGVIALMESVEIGRLAAARLGIGLIPFVYAGCAVACAMQATRGLWGRIHGYQIGAVLFWVLSGCITAAKLAAVTKFGTTGPLARLNTAYPIPDQVTDLAVEIPFYALLAGLEISLLYFAPPGSSGGSGMARLEDGIEMKP